MTVSFELGGTTTVVFFSGSRGALLLMQPGNHTSDAKKAITGRTLIVTLLLKVTGKVCNAHR